MPTSNGWKIIAAFGLLGVLALFVWAFMLGAWYGRTAPVALGPISAPPPALLGVVPVVNTTKPDYAAMAADFEKRHPPLAMPAAFPMVVPVETGLTENRGENSITITEIRGENDSITPGHVYQIKGTYTLTSGATCWIGTSTTARLREDGVGNPQSMQSAPATKGTHDFTVYLAMRCEGWPHMNMHDSTGTNLANVYFGTGDTLLKHW